MRTSGMKSEVMSSPRECCRRSPQIKARVRMWRYHVNEKKARKQNKNKNSERMCVVDHIQISDSCYHLLWFHSLIFAYSFDGHW
jgi:hypothetical protein